ncbi:sensor histidine kinase [Denitratisoma oestradiolicum]|uniref:histidine kinase n=1 Tax=Denitratisoma oestradiolicum TaxID=311182 RepID=A0A6S6Y4V5_9PROT|nr:sensor histidine kinase N-terminal domain-containing protein [Denitratisoma oestradiolicum]CAB1370410.1 Histidine kinase [Denitratisoma oestradiolicum]
MPERRFRRLQYAFNSLLGEILLWILTLLMLLWAISVVMTYQVADSLANQPYDEQLATEVRGLSRLVSVNQGRVTANFPGPAREILRADSKDRVYFQILGPDGHLVAGDKDLPTVDAPDVTDGTVVLFRDDAILDDEVRVAYSFLSLIPDQAPVLVQVAETRKKRLGLAASIVSGVIVPQFVIVPLAVLLVYLGLTHGITPLQRLQQELHSRLPSDLAPISVKGIPMEIRPILEALNDVMARLDDNLKVQRRFIADAAHQLKTPLTGLRTQTELALGETTSEAMRRGLRQVDLSAENLTHLIQQLLSLARAEASSSAEADFAPVDLNELVRVVAQEWADRALERRIDLGFESPGLPLWVRGNPFLLHEMFTNLIDNAIKYTPPGGLVTVRTSGDHEACRIEIEDSGIGIPEEDRQRVFERFYRALGTETDGSGLGLSIVKEVCELHRGSIAIDNPMGGKGTLVRVSLPAAPVM